MVKKTHVDQGQRLVGFSNPALVRCPRCDGPALVDRWGWEGKLTCPGCGLAKEKRAQTLGFGRTPVDPIFGLPLWIQMRCCSQTLWAYNWAHLSELRAYVEAELRTQTTRSTRSYFNALPKWIKAASNRRAILAAIDRFARQLAKSP